MTLTKKQAIRTATEAARIVTMAKDENGDRYAKPVDRSEFIRQLESLGEDDKIYALYTPERTMII